MNTSPEPSHQAQTQLDTRALQTREEEATELLELERCGVCVCVWCVCVCACACGVCVCVRARVMCVCVCVCVWCVCACVDVCMCGCVDVCMCDCYLALLLRDITDLHDIQTGLAGLVTEQGEVIDAIGQSPVQRVCICAYLSTSISAAV